jgi:hypothetical protein
MDWCKCQVRRQRCTTLQALTDSNYFGPTIYKNLGFGGNTTLMINGISGAWQVVVVWVFIQFIGKSFTSHDGLRLTN